MTMETKAIALGPYLSRYISLDGILVDSSTSEYDMTHLIQVSPIPFSSESGLRKTAVRAIRTNKRSLLAGILALLAVTIGTVLYLETRPVVVTVGSPEFQAVYIALLREKGIDFSVDRRGRIIVSKADSKRLSKVREEYRSYVQKHLEKKGQEKIEAAPLNGSEKGSAATDDHSH